MPANPNERTRRWLARSPCVETLEVRTLLSNLAYSVTTDKTAYAVGQPVQLTFTETNNSKQNITVDDGPSIDGFNIKLDGTTIWKSNSGINPLYIQAKTLAPGKSLSESATWYGESTTNPSIVQTGSFVVTNQLAPRPPAPAFRSRRPSPIASRPARLHSPLGSQFS